jgi:hypothetical protein
MKEQVLKREMFTKPMSKASKNSGIMAGFEDMEPEEDEMPPMARSPQNPEILMNNLRGDFRSVDARYAELAQMVGEEAASETPPEVLAMLQQQFAAPAAPPQPPQGGIGALPQGAGMAPPPEMMGSMAPPMPPGMEGAPPFPQGGADNAPPTPDGLPPLRAADGVFATQGARRARDPFSIDMNRLFELQSGNVPVEQMTPDDQEALRTYNMAMGFAGGSIRDVARPVANFLSTEAGYAGQYLKNKFGPTLAAVDRSLGNMLPSYFRAVERRGVDNKGIVAPARETLTPGPGRSVAGQGEGTRFVRPYDLQYGQFPLSERFSDAMARNPGATNAILGGGALTLGGMGVNEYINNVRRSNFMTPAPNQAELDARVNEIPMPNNAPPAPPGDVNAQARSQAANNFTPIPDNSPIFNQAETTAPAPKEQTTASFIDTQLKREAATEKDFGTRVKEGYSKLEPTFREILGDNKNDIRANALLLLADAGFKLASTKKATLGMAVSEALSGMPKGFAALIAQSKERDMKIKTAALQQAVDNVNLQDKYAMQSQIEYLKARTKKENTMLAGDYKLLEKQIEQGGVIRKDNGMGMWVLENKNGNVLGYQLDVPEIDPKTNKPTRNTPATDALQSRYTLRDTDNPYVQNRGPAPTTQETDKAERVKLGNTLRSLDNSLATLDNLKGTYEQVYGPGAWFNDKVNNLFVPISAGTIRPDVNLTDASTRISTGMNSILKNIASANDGGRVAVQEQEWARETAKGINDPSAFFANKEIAAKQFAAMEAMLRNSRQQVLTQLGYEGNDYVMSTPNTGTQNDPFVVPADPADQKRMFTFLGSTIGMVQDPRATVYVRMPNGTTQAFNPTALRGLIGK